MVDTLALGASARKGVEVRVLFPVPKQIARFFAGPRPRIK